MNHSGKMSSYFCSIYHVSPDLLDLCHHALWSSSSVVWCKKYLSIVSTRTDIALWCLHLIEHCCWGGGGGGGGFVVCIALSSAPWCFEHCGIGRWLQTSGRWSVVLKSRIWSHPGGDKYLRARTYYSTGSVNAQHWCYVIVETRYECVEVLLFLCLCVFIFCAQTGSGGSPEGLPSSSAWSVSSGNVWPHDEVLVSAFLKETTNVHLCEEKKQTCLA